MPSVDSQLFAAQLRRPLVQRLFALFGPGRARLVGGAVRDSLLGRWTEDIDLATPLQPEEVMARAAAAGLLVRPTGLAHGTASLCDPAAPRREWAEVTTLRQDLETDGRHARVAFTADWRADAARRDFTVNALSLDAEGRLHDPFGGLADLRAGRLRFVGDARQRIGEDYLRLLRLVRFWAVFGHQPIDAATSAAVAELADGLDRLAGERLWAELKKLLAARAAPQALRLCAQLGLDRRLIGQPFARLDQLSALRTRALVHGLSPIGLLLFQAVAMAPEGAGPEGAATERDAVALGRLPLSQAEREALRLPEVRPLAEQLYRFGRQRVGFALAGRNASFADWQRWHRWQAPDLPVRGADLLALGYRPGPAVGRALQQLERRWLASDCRLGRAELLATLPPVAA